MYPRARAGFQDFFSDLLGDAEQAAGGLASGAVQSIVIEAAAFPAITLSNPLAGVIPSGNGGSPAPASPPPFLLGLLKPRVTVNTAVGQFMLAPGGAPPAFPWLMWTGLGVVALAAYGAATLLAPQRGYARRALPSPQPPTSAKQLGSGYRKSGMAGVSDVECGIFKCRHLAVTRRQHANGGGSIDLCASCESDGDARALWKPRSAKGKAVRVKRQAKAPRKMACARCGLNDGEMAGGLCKKCRGRIGLVDW